MSLPAASVVGQVRLDLRGTPSFLAGSVVAALTYDKPYAYDDADVFVPSPLALISNVQFLQDKGYTLNDTVTKP